MMTNAQTNAVAANYWGYRELTSQELTLVGGGDDGGDCGAGGDCGDSGGSCGPGGDCGDPGNDGSVIVAEANPTQQTGNMIAGVGAVVGIATAATPPGAAVAVIGGIAVGVGALGGFQGGTTSPSPTDSPNTTNPMGDTVNLGKVICTELCRNGVIPREMWVADIRYSQAHFSERTLRGYHVWGVPYVRLMRRHRVFARMIAAPTRWFAEDVAYRMGVHPRPNWKGWALRELGFRPFCALLGIFAQARDWRALWADEGARA